MLSESDRFGSPILSESKRAGAESEPAAIPMDNKPVTAKRSVFIEDEKSHL
jgi:hypothetical protein